MTSGSRRSPSGTHNLRGVGLEVADRLDPAGQLHGHFLSSPDLVHKPLRSQERTSPFGNWRPNRRVRSRNLVVARWVPRRNHEPENRGECRAGRNSLEKHQSSREDPPQLSLSEVAGGEQVHAVAGHYGMEPVVRSGGHVQRRAWCVLHIGDRHCHVRSADQKRLVRIW